MYGDHYTQHYYPEAVLKVLALYYYRELVSVSRTLLLLLLLLLQLLL
jgi:hypothetical protein